jgi:hypothetical protein
MAFMGDKRIAFTILVGISQGKKQIRIPRDGDSKQIYVKGLWWKNVAWIYMAEDR